MKYIRTKDGIYNKSKIICSAFNEEYCSPDWNEDIEKYLQTKIVAEADTIEELYDELVVCFDSNVKPVVVGYSIYWAKHYAGTTGHIMGAIWTDKGLIYVAKMNDEGKFELL